MSDTLHKTSPLFITARFRTGSTMLWNLFRQLPETRAYYEPLHEKIPSFMKYPIRPEKSHLFVKSYFDEYRDAPRAISIHQSDFANHRLFLESEDAYPELRDYIQALVESVPLKKMAILQFNRIDFRLAWIKKNFTNARLLHLTRNPRDQWYSTLATFNVNIDHFIDFDGYDLATWARDLYKQFPFLAAPKLEHAYQRFYFIWKLSYLAGHRTADLSMAYEDILAEPEKNLIQILELADLYSDNNLETCLKFIKSKPERSWKKHRSDAWFLDMEQKCEEVLDELGLNENFALKPLSEIQKNSSKYRSLLLDPENDRWAERSFKQVLSLNRSESFEINYHYQIALNELSAAKLKIDELNQSFNQALMEVDRLRQELREVYNSTSWRITMPLRKISDLVRWTINLLTGFKLASVAAARAILKKFLTSGMTVVVKHPSLKNRVISGLSRYPNMKTRLKRLAMASGIVYDSNYGIQELSLRARQIHKDLLDAIKQNKMG